VENRGTLDAKLESIEDNIKTTNEAIKISFTGYTKGEKLYKNTSKKIIVKIEYNPDFNGTPEEGSSEISIDLTYNQAEGGTVTPTDKYLVTYDCTANGGDNCSSYNEYLNEGDTVNLNHTSSKEGYEFIGWNTNKDAEDGLRELQMLNSDITLYAIYKDITPPTCNLTVTNATIDKVTVKADCQDISGIKEYRYIIGDIDEVITENTYNLNNYNLSELIIEVTDNANNKGSFNINQDNLQKGYQLIYSALHAEISNITSDKKQYEEEFLNKTYPVGSIYITESNTNPSETIGGTWEEYGKGKTLVGVDLNDTNFNTVNKLGGSKTNTLAVTNLPSHTHSIPILSGTAAQAGAHTNPIPALSGSTSTNGSHTHQSWTAYNPNSSMSFAISGLSTSGYTWIPAGTMAHNIVMVDPAGNHSHTVTTTASNSGSSESHTHNVTTVAKTSGSIGSGNSFTNIGPYTTVYMYKRIS
ncbi:MAG: hypothetical protein HFH46_02170, partial [Bacilli bacterium]|nr:hypothetical protein [Bacilli bacterium]